MSAERIRIEKGTVQETLLIPLYARKLCSERFASLYHDPATIITLLSEELSDLVVLRELSRRLMVRTRDNYRFILGFNTGLMAAGIFGILTPQTTSILHNLSTMMLSGISTRPLFDDADVPVLV